jgi:H+/Cl- antiporter ClcA
MGSGAIAMVVVIVIVIGTLTWLLAAMFRSVHDERSPTRSLWREFGLSIALLVLFVASWAGQAIAEWQRFTDEQRAHGEDPAIGDFVSEFGQSTLENWQSEFLQLFSFVTLAALYIHKGSGESKDGTEKMEASLRRIEEHLGTLPPTAPSESGQSWKLAETPLEVADQQAARA